MNIIANELIPVYDNDGDHAINTRDLHEFLEVGKAYSDWFKYRADQMGMVDGEDFITILGKSTGGRPTTDYIVSIDTGKEMAMMENNDKGREVRRYFIAVEKKYRAKPMSHLEILAESAKALVDHDRRLSLVEKKQDVVIEALTAPVIDDWEAQIKNKVLTIIKHRGYVYQTYWQELYIKLEATARVDLAARKNNKIKRMKDAGCKSKEYNAVSKLSIIASDPQLKAIFEDIVRMETARLAIESIGGESA